MSGLVVLTVGKAQPARLIAARFLLEVSPGTFAGVINARVRGSLLAEVAQRVPQYTMVWSEGGKICSESQGSRYDGRRLVEHDGLPLVSVPDNTERGRMFRKRISFLPPGVE